MPRPKLFPYVKMCQFTAETSPQLKLVSAARDTTDMALIREYVTRGLAQDIARLGLHLKDHRS